MDDFQKIISSFKGATNTDSTGAATTPEKNPVIDILTARLEEQGKGISTSASSELQNAITGAIADTKKAGAATSARLQSERSREMAYAEDRASAQFTTALEGRTGYATQVAGLRELTETTTKSIRDLDQRYQEAILSNDANTASQMAQLRMQKLEFIQRQEEQFYSNLFSLANIVEQDASRRQQAGQFERGLTHDQQMMREKFGFDFAMVEKQTRTDERNMMLELAAENGVTVAPGETIDSMVAKISPLVSRKKALELESIRADINRSNAEVERALAGTRKDNERLDTTDIGAFAAAYRMMPEGSELLLNLAASDQGKVIKEVNRLDDIDQQSLIERAKQYDNIADFMKDMEDENIHDQKMVQRAAATIVEKERPGLFSKITSALAKDSSKASSSRFWPVIKD